MSTQHQHNIRPSAQSCSRLPLPWPMASWPEKLGWGP